MTATIIPFPRKAAKSEAVQMADTHTHTHYDARFEPWVIFALDEGIPVSAFTEWAQDNGIGFKALKGCYKGQEEDSYLANARHWGQIMLRFCEGQESVLHLSPVHPSGFRQATLIPVADPSQPIVPLGRWICVGSQRPETDAWTYDPTSYTYYVTDGPAKPAA